MSNKNGRTTRLHLPGDPPPFRRLSVDRRTLILDERLHETGRNVNALIGQVHMATGQIAHLTSSAPTAIAALAVCLDRAGLVSAEDFLAEVDAQAELVRQATRGEIPATEALALRVLRGSVKPEASPEAEGGAS